MQLRRVVVTGIGAVTPLGLTARESWQSLIAGKSGLCSISDYIEHRCDPESKLRNLDFYPKETYVAPIQAGFDSAKQWKVKFSSNRMNSYALAATTEALQDSKLLPLLAASEELQESSGVNIGVMSSNIPRLTEIIRDTAAATTTTAMKAVNSTSGFATINHFTLFQILSNMPTANMSIQFQLKGPSSTASTACATGASAIGDAFRNIQLGEAKVMVAGGTEDSISPTTLNASVRLRAIVSRKFDQPEHASRPFDEDRAGFIMGEGAGVVVLEELDHALKRGAHIYAELVSYGQSSDAFHLTRPMDNGEGGLRAMKKALAAAGIHASDVDHINAHATSTVAGDVSEAIALSNLLGESINNSGSKQITVTANKGAIGHTFGAAGAIESIFTILSVHEGVSPKILNLQKPIGVDARLHLTTETKEQSIRYALKNSFGFGGVNVSLLFKKFTQ